MKLPNELNELIEKTKLLQTLNHALIELLPPAMIGHCELLNYRDEQLILSLDSSTWLMRLRFDLERLQHEFQKKFPKLRIQSIELKVQPKAAEKIEIPVPKPEALSAETRRLLKSTAENVSHKKLREALLKLSSS